MLRWHRSKGVDYAWRQVSDPWLILAAELLLRRTRARQAEAVLAELAESYPSPEAMAHASSQSVHETLRSAGLAQRIDQLHLAAIQLAMRHGGQVPHDQEELMELPGVGPYVARAVAARLSGEPVVLIDTNTVRIAIRVLGIEPRTKDPRRERRVIEGIAELFDGPATIDVWWATIDLAHLVCRQEPLCDVCPLSRNCEYSAVTSESDTTGNYAANK